MSIASLPMILFVLPLFTLLAALTPARWQSLALALGGVSIIAVTGGFPAVILLLLSVASAWLVMRLQKQRTAAFWFGIGIGIQGMLLLLGKFLLNELQLIPLMICAMQNFECLRARTQRKFAAPALYPFFCYQCDMTRLPAGPLLEYHEAAARREERCVTAENIGEGASKCIRGLFLLVCLSQPMFRLEAALKPSAGFDALLDALSYYFAVYYALRGTARIGQGLAQMLGILLPDSFDDPLFADSPQDFRKRFLTPFYEWTERVLLPVRVQNDAGAYFARMTLLFGGLGLMFGRSIFGIVWGILTAGVLTAEHFYKARRRAGIPVQVRRFLTAAAVLLSMGLLCSDSIFDCFSYYGALLGANGFSLSAAAGYFAKTNMLVLLLCTAGLFPLRKLGAQLPKYRLPVTVCRIAGEAVMLLSAYSELLSNYLRS